MPLPVVYCATSESSPNGRERARDRQAARPRQSAPSCADAASCRRQLDPAARGRRPARDRARSRSAGARRDPAVAPACARSSRGGPRDGPPALLDAARDRPPAAQRNRRAREPLLRPTSRRSARCSRASSAARRRRRTWNRSCRRRSRRRVARRVAAATASCVPSRSRENRLAWARSVIVPSAVGVSDSQLTCDWRTESRRSESAGPNGVADTRNVSCSGPVCLLRVASPSSCTKPPTRNSVSVPGSVRTLASSSFARLRIRAAADDGRPVLGGGAADAASTRADGERRGDPPRSVAQRAIAGMPR